MSKKWMIGLATAAFLAPSAAAAQESGAAVVTGSVNQGGGGRGGRVIAGAIETKITTGRPYSAEAVTETTQVLGDGNRIQNRSVTRVYRDGEGRTRREMFDRDGTLITVSISDPVAKTSYTLDPKTKTAYQMGGNVVAPVVSGSYVFTERSGGTATVTANPSETRVAIASGGGGTGGGTVSIARTPAPDDPNNKKEDLGIQNIEGVSAVGTRTTRVIPAGAIGNVQEIRVVSEQWFSEELQALVMTRHNDPRNGETVYRLTNILRAEPDQNLFTVPADYKIEERRVRRPQ